MSDEKTTTVTVSGHCHKCCEKHSIGVQLVAKLLELWLCWWAAGYFAPSDWSDWKQLAAVVIIVGLWR
jgi:hypothetical protein